jgi:predicted outer membrane repeat protein
VSGGAVCNWTSAAHILYCTFACNYSGSGGAIWNSPDNTGAIIRDCRFGENGAYSGGAIENWGYCSVQDCWFFGNIATNEGGAISNTGRSNTVRACAFLLNRADKRGGAIYNSCDLGEIIDCAFADNRTADDGLGGGICNYKSSDLSIVKCRFEDNFARRGGGIGNDNSTLEVINCAFTDNTAEDGAGMYNVYTRGVPMINCTLKDNSATRYGGGVFSLASGDDNPELINCVVWNNTDTDGLRESEWSQIYCVDGKPTVRYSCVQGWTGTWGGVMNTGADPEFADSSGALSLTSPCVDAGDNTGVPNDEWDLDGDIDNAERLPLDLAGNPRFVDYAGASDRGKGDAPIVDMGAYEFGTENGHPITAIFVDENAPAGGADDGSSWENAFHFLQDALAAAEPGSHILVAQGTYTPDLGTNHRPLHREESFVIKNSVTLLGGYAGNTLKRPLAADPSIRNLSVYETILSGDLNHDDVSISDPGVLLNHACRDDNSYCVVSCEVAGGPVLLDGFTISGGNGTEDSDSMNDSSRSGAGIYTPETRMKITRCIFANNAAPYVGGALWVGRESDVEVLDCVFRYNWGGRYGGAIALDSSYSKIKNCVFETNGASRGGALYVSTLPGAVLGTSHCRFNNNRGTISAGAILVDQGALELSYCAFRGNTAPTSGGAIHLSGASGPDSVLAYRCTFAQNSASNGAALCAWATGTVAVDSCILWDTLDGTSQDEIWSDPSDPATTVSVEYSCVAKGWHSDSMTNIAVDPRFADNELHLHFSSPCVDRGSSEALVDAQDALDLDGNPAWVGDRPDMGAYEHQETQQAAVVELNEDNIGEWISLGVVLVDFYSPGCSFCQLQLPILDEVARQVGDKAIVAKCNTDRMSLDAIKQYDIVFLPTLILFKDGETEKRWEGLQEAATLISAIMDALK